MAYLALIVEDVIINKWEIEEQDLLIGRASDCDIQIEDKSVSSKHARILVEADPYLDNATNVYLDDLMSTNGTLLNGREIHKEKLSDGDMIKIGFNQFRFVGEASVSLDDTAVIIM